MDIKLSHFKLAFVQPDHIYSTDVYVYDMSVYIRSNITLVILLVTDNAMELYNRLLFLISERATLDIRPEIVGPPEATALPAPAESCTTAHSFKCGPTIYTNVMY